MAGGRENFGSARFTSWTISATREGVFVVYPVVYLVSMLSCSLAGKWVALIVSLLCAFCEDCTV